MKQSIHIIQIVHRIVLALLLIGLGVVAVNILSIEAQRMGINGLLNNGLKAFLFSSLVVTGLWFLRKKNRFDSGNIGFEKPRVAIKHFLFGISLIMVPLLITIILSMMMGWGGLKINVTASILESLAWIALFTFLTDALPEEIIFRGYIYANLNLKYHKLKAALITTFVFALMPVFSMLVQNQLLGYPVNIGGANTVTVGYTITLLLFGAFMIYLRILSGSVWTSIGFHLVFVFMNQLMGPGDSQLIQFTDTEGEQAMQITLVSLIILTFAILLIWPRLTKSSLGWNEKATS
jgi:membrane protease YdiL (CAAX protease family)